MEATIDDGTGVQLGQQTAVEYAALASLPESAAEKVHCCGCVVFSLFVVIVTHVV
jgi:hypothetical protein